MLILSGILTREQQDHGLTLEEDDHNLFLMHRGEVAPLAVWTARMATITDIVNEAYQHLQWHRSGVSIESDPYSNFETGCR